MFLWGIMQRAVGGIGVLAFLTGASSNLLVICSNLFHIEIQPYRSELYSEICLEIYFGSYFYGIFVVRSEIVFSTLCAAKKIKNTSRNISTLLDQKLTPLT